MSAPVLDLSHLPKHGFGMKSPVLWGTILLACMEGMGFLLLLTAYLYVHGNFKVWPPAPELRLGPATWAVAAYLAAVPPSLLAWRACRREDYAGTRRWFVIATLVCAVALGLRAAEIAALPFSWNLNAYASIVWTTTGLHVLETIATVGDGAFLCVVLFLARVDRKHFVDIETSVVFTLFVIAIWLPLYGLIYAEGVMR